MAVRSSLMYVGNVITDRIIGDMTRAISKKNLNMQESKEVDVGIRFEDIEGVHTVTIIWYQPDGSVYHIDERTLEAEYKVDAVVWFWLKFSDMKAEYCVGAWTVDVFIDGRKIVRDNFIINRKMQEHFIGFMCTA